MIVPVLQLAGDKRLSDGVSMTVAVRATPRLALRQKMAGPISHRAGNLGDSG